MNFICDKLSPFSFFAVALISFGLFACGGDSGTSGETGSNDISVQVESQEDLPNCSKKRDGEIAEVLEEKKAYVCNDGRWQFDHDILDSVKTEDDLSACTAKNEGDSVWVVKESAVFVCTDRKWEKHAKEEPSKDEIPSYDSEDDMPSCNSNREGNLALVKENAKLCTDKRWTDLGTAYSSLEDLPNCTSKRKDESVYVIEDSQKLVCDGKKWQEDEAVEIPKSSSSKTAKSSSSAKATSSSGKASSSNSKASSSSKVGSSSSKKAESSDSKTETLALDSIKDPRDNKFYKIAKIGDQVWFAQNLNYDDRKSVCPMKESDNCLKYGRLYKFFADIKDDNTASSLDDVCPSGWHVPDSLEWETLLAFVKKNNGGEPVGVSLKATSGWITENDTVLIKGDGNLGRGSMDSTRIGATKGTNRFGFSALPAGSCWDTGCYVGDDSRFVVQVPWSDRGYGIKLAFDKNDYMLEEDAYFGYISVRCIQNKSLKIDSMPPVVAIDTLLWMAENLSVDGSDEFLIGEAMTLCPSGWRLPTSYELERAVNANKMSFPADKTTEYFVTDVYAKGSTVNCATGRCYSLMGASSSLTATTKRAVRCVNDTYASSFNGLGCAASNYNEKDSTVVWTVNKGKANDYKISGYDWNFGAESSNVQITDNNASLKFTSNKRFAPSVTVNGSVEIASEKYKLDIALSCPAVEVVVDTSIVFKQRENVLLFANTKYSATYECGKTYVSAKLFCTLSSNKTETVTINGKKFTGSYTISGDIEDYACTEKPFSIEASVEMTCRID